MGQEAEFSQGISSAQEKGEKSGSTIFHKLYYKRYDCWNPERSWVGGSLGLCQGMGELPQPSKGATNGPGSVPALAWKFSESPTPSLSPTHYIGTAEQSAFAQVNTEQGQDFCWL